MALNAHYLPYSQTHSFSKLVLDYLSAHPQVQPFYRHTPDREGLKQAIADRERCPVNRGVLVETLYRQYEKFPFDEKVHRNIGLLAEQRTFTVCTAHQPNLLTGYLYFIYKILHAIKLSEELNVWFPDRNFVPVYYMGSEDNDLEELGTFRYDNRKFVWKASGQTGAVGRMSTGSLRPLLNDLFDQLGPPGQFCEELKELIAAAYLEHDTVATATRYLVHRLFARFGLVILDPDDRELKLQFLPVMKDDLLTQTSHGIVSSQIEKLSEHYKVQAHPRPINLFYLGDGVRERIERSGDTWSVLNTTIHWNEQELLAELQLYPERFSPNVILRGLFQETVLPDVAFIGGGGEIAYWLQLETLFRHYGVCYPPLHLRQSVLWLTQKKHRLRLQLGIDVAELFEPESELTRRYIGRNSIDDWQTAGEIRIIESSMEQLKKKATTIDPNLKASAEAAMAKIRHQVQVLEKKMLRSEKRKMQEGLLRVKKLKTALFPDGNLQERVENFTDYYLEYGQHYFDILLSFFDPSANEFLILEENR